MSASSDDPPIVPDLRQRLPRGQGRLWWRSLHDLARAPEFLPWLEREFPEQASEWNDPAGRRRFLELMGASLALAGVAGCTRQPPETVVPYVKPPEDVVPGRPLFFATAVLDSGYAKGVLVESHMGRPTKVEGNPDHPASLGATDAFAQASVLTLYDPDRSQTLTQLGEIRPWGTLLAAMRTAMAAERAAAGAGLRILTGAVTSPALAAQIGELLAGLPGARWHRWEPAAPYGASGAGVGPEARYDLAQADVVLSLEADFVGSGPGNLRYIRDFASRRRARAEEGRPSRLWVVESSPSLTGSVADERLPLRASQVEGFARAVAAALGAAGAPAAGGAVADAFLQGVVRDLREAGGRSLVMAGQYQPRSLHALARSLNERLGNVGTTVTYGQSFEAGPSDHLASITELTRDMMAGNVRLLVILGGNPVYTAPADLGFAQQLDKVPLRVHLGLYEDETAERCHWHVPEAHPLESWGDAVAYDGTATLLQPLIAPLYGGRSAHEVLATLTDRPERSAYDIIREHWQKGMGGDFERAWRQALHDGLVRTAPAVAAAAGAAAPAASPPPPVEAVTGVASGADFADGGLELVFRPDPCVHDGRWSNNGWLQELPKPLTKLTWDNAALVSPATAARLGLENEDEVELRYRGRAVKAPVWVLPGQAEGSVTVHLGYGRTRAGRVGTSAGFDAYALRTSDAPWFGAGLEVRKTGRRLPLACTQDHWSMEGRDLVRVTTLEETRRDPHQAPGKAHRPPRELTMYPEWKYTGHAWGMAIDLNACVGCNACVVACQAENNVPVVGKDQVRRGREMQWLRIDRYFAGPPDNPRTMHQPVPCMHCETAPCEVVCPVAATVHSDEGLNEQVYNRCVGTRYCSHNCPYKVRRFNFLLYSDFKTPSLKLQRNPDVTVRSRGVMEKCTYCVQRINEARIQAKNEGRPVRDGEVKTACQQVCPAEAIVFGDVNDPQSRVSRLKAQPRSYGLLEELNTRPRTTYLAAVRNPDGSREGGEA